MGEQVTFGDFILGLEGLAILRAWMADSDIVVARRRKVQELAGRLAEEPWSNPIFAEEKDVSSGYSEWADTYDAGRNPVVIAEEPVVHALLDLYPLGTLLDAACGTGGHAAYLASLGHQVTGIDRNPEMLDVASEKVPGARFEIADLTAIPLTDGQMDIAVCTLALTHCPDLGPPVKELARVVRPGGRVVISDVHPFLVMLGTHGAYRSSSDEMGFVKNRVHLPSDYLRAFWQAGLKVVQCLEPLWGEKEIATFGFADQMPDLVEAAVEGLPIVVVWELERNG
jgi:ubiquinone/menaquinone biosynthesis C-methylase UbiE